eukprot:Hpha_TRINITY_DN25965_c0_g1::TRINITY_DN25965_c0_g1_i1::g.185315::m.185315
MGVSWRPGGSGELQEGQWPAVDRRPLMHANLMEPESWGIPALTVQLFVLFFGIHVCSTVLLYLARGYIAPKFSLGDFIVPGQEVTSLTAALMLGILGIQSQIRQFREPMADPLFGEDEGSRTLGQIMFALQSYTTLTAICVPAFRTPKMLIHHIVSSLLAQQSMVPYLHGYAVFYFGIVEITNWALCPIDFLRALPELQKKVPGLYSVLRMVFAVSFILIRLLAWTVMALFFWYDSIALLSSGRSAPLFAVYCFLVCNIIMTGLQWIWGRLVLRGIYETLNPDAKKQRQKRSGHVQTKPAPEELTEKQ